MSKLQWKPGHKDPIHASRPEPGAQRRGPVGHSLRQRVALGEAEESKTNGQREVAPGLSAGTGLPRHPPMLWGKARRRTGLPILNECKASVRVLGGDWWLWEQEGDFHRRLAVVRRVPGLEGRAP